MFSEQWTVACDTIVPGSVALEVECHFTKKDTVVVSEAFIANETVPAKTHSPSVFLQEALRLLI